MRPRAERSSQAAVAPRASYPVMLSSIISERRPADLKCLGRRTWSCPSRYGAMGDETGARLRVLLPFDWPPARSEVQSCTGTKPTASGGKAGRSNASLANGMKGEQQRSKFVLCIRNGGSDDLEVRKVYQVFQTRPPRTTGTCALSTNPARIISIHLSTSCPYGCRRPSVRHCSSVPRSVPDAAVRRASYP